MVIGTYGSGTLTFADNVSKAVPTATRITARNAPATPSAGDGHNAAASSLRRGDAEVVEGIFDKGHSFLLILES
jgi:hypothetical protein